MFALNCGLVGIFHSLHAALHFSFGAHLSLPSGHWFPRLNQKCVYGSSPIICSRGCLRSTGLELSFMQVSFDTEVCWWRSPPIRLQVLGTNALSILSGFTTMATERSWSQVESFVLSLKQRVVYASLVCVCVCLCVYVFVWIWQAPETMVTRMGIAVLMLTCFIGMSVTVFVINLVWSHPFLSLIEWWNPRHQNKSLSFSKSGMNSKAILIWTLYFRD